MINVNPEYFPETDVGSRYEYSMEYLAPLGGVGRASMIRRVDGVETLHGKRYYKIVDTYLGIPGQDQQVFYSRWTPDGIYLIDGDRKDKPEYLAIPFPVSVGISWVANNDKSTTYHAEGLETIETPNETYKDCLKVSFKDAGAEGTEYLAPNVGRVKLVTRGLTLTLQKYKK